MRRALASALAVLVLATAAQAQFLPRPGVGGGTGTPGSPLSGGIGSSAPSAGFSPYLNLLRGGSAAVNYYGIVRPQQNVQAALQAVQQQQAGGASFEPDDPTMPGIVVGTRVRFLNTSGYFLNMQGGTTVGGGTGVGSGMGGRTGTQGNQGFASQGTGTGAGLGTGFGTFGAGTGGTRGTTRPR